MLLLLAGLSDDQQDLRGCIGSNATFPEELDKIIRLYFEKRSAFSSAVSNLEKRFPVPLSVGKRSRSSEDLADNSEASDSRSRAEKASQFRTPRWRSVARRKTEECEMRLVESNSMNSEEYPVEPLIDDFSDKKMRSLKQRRETINSSSLSNSRVASATLSDDGRVSHLADESDLNVLPESGKITASDVLAALACPDENLMLRVLALEEEMNVAPRCWDLLVTETDPKVIALLMWDWYV